MPKRLPIWQAAVAGLAVLGAAAGFAGFQHWQVQARLLRADPDNLPPALLRYAADHGGGVFQAHCAQCHGAAGKGDPSLGVPDLTDREWLYGSGRISEIAQTIRHGIRAGDPRGHDLADMPAFAQPRPYAREALLPLSPDDVEDVVAFLLRQQGRAPETDAARRGDKIFHTSGACWDCHGQDAKGDNNVGAPNLTGRTRLYGDGSPAELFRSIADGHAGRCPAWTGRLSPAQILEAAVYVWSQGGKS